MSKPSKPARKPAKKSPAPAAKKGSPKELTVDDLVAVSGGASPGKKGWCVKAR